MIEIIPAILTDSWNELDQELQRLRGVSPLVQIDITEEKLLAGHESFPLWEEFDFELDLLLNNPAGCIPQAASLGASRIVVHARHDGAGEALESLQAGRDGEFPVLTGIALGAHDTPEALEPFAGLYDYVQVMGIGREGVQGESFDKEAIELLRRLRAMHPALTLQVDGGVRLENARALAEAGADRLVAGSAILRTDDPKAAYKALYTEANAL